MLRRQKREVSRAASRNPRFVLVFFYLFSHVIPGKLHLFFNTQTRTHTVRERKSQAGSGGKRDAVSCQFAISTFYLQCQHRTRSCKPFSISFRSDGGSDALLTVWPFTESFEQSDTFLCPPSSAKRGENRSVQLGSGRKCGTFPSSLPFNRMTHADD